MCGITNADVVVVAVDPSPRNSKKSLFNRVVGARRVEVEQSRAGSKSRATDICVADNLKLCTGIATGIAFHTI